MKGSSSGVALPLLPLSIVGTAITCAAAAQSQQPPASTANTVVAGSNTMSSIEFRTSSGNVLQSSGGAWQSLQAMRNRLQDPVERAAIREEQRTQVLEINRSIEQALDLDAATAAKLIELLTDQQMDHLDAFHRVKDAAALAQSGEGQSLANAEEETQRIKALRELLGEEKLERYQAFKSTYSARVQVGMLEARLDPAHQLQRDQKERLIALYDEHSNRDIAEFRLATYRSSFGAIGSRFSLEDLQRASQLDTISANETIWRRMPGSDRSLRQDAAAFLTAPQLATLAQLNDEKARSLQQRIETMRTQAGLSAAIPDAPQSSTQRTALTGKVKLSLELKVNRGATSFTHVGGNGEPVTFTCADGLLVEATPTVYDDSLFDLRLAYYEAGSTGRRLIGGGGQMGEIVRVPTGLPDVRGRNRSNTVLSGSKAYAVEIDARVEPM